MLTLAIITGIMIIMLITGIIVRWIHHTITSSTNMSLTAQQSKLRQYDPCVFMGHTPVFIRTY